MATEPKTGTQLADELIWGLRADTQLRERLVELLADDIWDAISDRVDETASEAADAQMHDACWTDQVERALDSLLDGRAPCTYVGDIASEVLRDSLRDTDVCDAIDERVNEALNEHCEDYHTEGFTGVQERKDGANEQVGN